ncbi:DUF2189 domain-containing protein [Thiohalocapsa sp. ML1]|jgi:uncharacterized membrane protein|uniref:DUF2189 domain-containing protein n=1 Tax=Thiohalocapsa sp. ML1 TaxID=1431688 RepID=UPI00073221F0|nr:DUF2189 domain-containing protein [Thiohalocapsa sp. ML1]
MTTYHLSTAQTPHRAYHIPHLSMLRPLTWLSRGFADLVAMPRVSAAYGAGVAALAFLMVYLTFGASSFVLVPFLFGGFLSIAPILSVGLIAMAKRREEPNNDQSVVKILSLNASSLALLGLLLVMVFLNWIMLSNLTFGGFFGEVTPTYGQVRPLPVMFGKSWPFALIYGGIALVLALVLFRMVALALPMLVDQRVDVFNAIFASWRAVGENWPSMLVWAALLFLLTSIGIGLYFIGLIVVVPWLGYATWHAYRDTLILEEGASD